MKILHIAKKYPKAIGGDAVVVANLQHQQETAGHKVIIVTSNCDDIDSGPLVYKIGLKDTPKRLDTITLTRLVSLILLFFKMFAIVAKERPDVIHTHSVDMAFFASFAARFFGVPIVHTFHIVTFYDTDQSLLRRKTEIWLAKRAKPHKITAPNTYDVQKLRRAGLRHATLLPNGVDLSFWKHDNLQTQDQPFLFVSVGRLEKQKGYHYLIKAAALLANMPPASFKVIIVGAGSQKQELLQLIHMLDLKDIVELAGVKTPQQTRELLAQASAVIVPSLYETTPISLLEAWAAKLPVIATPVGILRGAPADFDAAYIVPTQDEQVLMLAMHECITNAVVRQNVAAKGHDTVRQYAWPIVAKKAESMYRSIA